MKIKKIICYIFIASILSSCATNVISVNQNVIGDAFANMNIYRVSLADCALSNNYTNTQLSSCNSEKNDVLKTGNYYFGKVYVENGNVVTVFNDAKKNIDKSTMTYTININDSGVITWNCSYYSPINSLNISSFPDGSCTKSEKILINH